MMAALTWPCAALRDADLSARTTIRVGGSAEWLLEPAHPDELVAAWNAARERGFLPRILGGGANLLVPDGRLPGVVITTERMSRVFRPQRDDPTREGDEFAPLLPALVPQERDEDTRLIVWAGCSMPGLVRITRDLGWSGLEGLAGVPGHLGGGVAMNAGGRWGEMWDVVERVRVLTPEGELRELERAQCAPRYRDGNLAGALVLGAVLRLRVDERAVVRERVAGFLREKSAAQPVTERSCGCIFKNPDPARSDGRGAGQLIEAAGGKGLARGDAVVSEKHGNFIVNRGHARAADVLALIEDVRARVAERFGLRLETEVKVWPGPATPAE
jgi:UDP-N-acetylmuramate dehydrogenase